MTLWAKTVTCRVLVELRLEPAPSGTGGWFAGFTRFHFSAALRDLIVMAGHGAAIEPPGLLSKRVWLPGEVALPHAAGTALLSRVFSGYQVPCDSKVHEQSAGPPGTCGGRGQNLSHVWTKPAL